MIKYCKGVSFSLSIFGILDAAKAPPMVTNRHAPARQLLTAHEYDRIWPWFSLAGSCARSREIKSGQMVCFDHPVSYAVCSGWLEHAWRHFTETYVYPSKSWPTAAEPLFAKPEHGLLAEPRLWCKLVSVAARRDWLNQREREQTPTLRPPTPRKFTRTSQAPVGDDGWWIGIRPDPFLLCVCACARVCMPVLTQVSCPSWLLTWQSGRQTSSLSNVLIFNFTIWWKMMFH